MSSVTVVIISNNYHHTRIDVLYRNNKKKYDIYVTVQNAICRFAELVSKLTLY